MNSQKNENFSTIQKVLIGCETLNPESVLLPRIRFAIETLTYHRDDDEKILSDFFSMIKAIGPYPATALLEGAMHAADKKEEVENTLKVIDYFFDEPQFENFRLILQNFEPAANSGSAVDKILKKILHDFSRENQSEFSQKLVLLLLETNAIEKVRKMLDLYGNLYDENQFAELKSGYDHYLDSGDPDKFYSFLTSLDHTGLIEAYLRVKRKYSGVNFSDTFSKGQIKSKLWLIEELEKLGLQAELKTILMVCGWHGLLFKILTHRWGDAQLTRLRSVDIDPECAPIADEYNKGLVSDQWRFKAITADIFEIMFNGSVPPRHVYLPLENAEGKRWTEKTLFDLVINTSCEHIKDFGAWWDQIGEGQLVVLQSNDYFELEEHVNCVNSTAEFRDQAPMSKCLFSGALPLENYTRYMLIGYK